MKKTGLTIMALILAAGLCQAAVVMTSDTPEATAYNGGRHLVRIEGTNDLRTAALSGDSIYYSKSDDGGNAWAAAPAYIGDGHWPTIALDKGNYPNICWVNMIPGFYTRIFYAKESAGGWTSGILRTNCWEMYPYGIYGAAHHSQPSLFIDKADSAHIIVGEYGFVAPEAIVIPEDPIGTWLLNGGKLSVNDLPGVKWETWKEEDLYGGPFFLSDVSNCLNPAKDEDTLYVCWYNPVDGEVYFREKTASGWKPIENLSQSSKRSASPFVDTYGDSIRVVYEEEQADGTHEIFYTARRKIVGGIPPDGDWTIPKNISNTAGDSRYPTIAGNHIIWQELVDAATDNWDIYFDGTNITSTTQPERYAHSNFQQLTDGQYIHMIWTQDKRPTDECPVWYQGQFLFGAKLAWASVDAGGVEPSPYTVYRDGYKVYASDTVTIDYAYDELIYRFSGLRLPYRYELQVVGYHEEPTQGNHWNSQVKVDGEVAKVLKLKTGIPDTAKIDIPESYYSDDGVIEVKVKRLTGDFASVDKVLLYQYEPEEKPAKSGGAQSTSLGEDRIQKTEFKLQQNAPNPFKQQTAISYQLPVSGPVTLTIYDVTGRLVKTLVDAEQAAGQHSLTWDGKDVTGKTVANGVYLYRLIDGNTTATKKLTFIR